MTTYGDFAREEMLKRGLLFFGDVLDEVRTLPDTATRAAIAVAAAYRLVQDQIARGTPDAVALECAEAVESMALRRANGAG